MLKELQEPCEKARCEAEFVRISQYEIYKIQRMKTVEVEGRMSNSTMKCVNCTNVLFSAKLPKAEVHHSAMLAVSNEPKQEKTLQNITHLRLSCCSNTRKHCKMPFIGGLSLAGVSNGADRGSICFGSHLETVSYTHLTLPTNREV